MELQINGRRLTCSRHSQDGAHELWEIRDTVRNISWFLYRDARTGCAPTRYVGFRHPAVSRNGGIVWSVWEHAADSVKAILIPLLQRHLGPAGQMSYGEQDQLYCHLLHNGAERQIYWAADCGYDAWEAAWPQVMAEAGASPQQSEHAPLLDAIQSLLPDIAGCKNAWL